MLCSPSAFPQSEQLQILRLQPIMRIELFELASFNCFSHAQYSGAS